MKTTHQLWLSPGEQAWCQSASEPTEYGVAPQFFSASEIALVLH